MKCRKIILSFSFILFAINCFGQDHISKSRLDSLILLRNKSLKSAHIDDVRLGNDYFKELLINTIENYKIDEHKLDSIPFFNCLSSSDGMLYMMNWNIPNEYSNHEYFCVIYIIGTKKKQAKIIDLKDQDITVEDARYRTFDKNKWYGALYYDMIPVKHKKTKYYVLLGFDLNDGVTNKKIIDVMDFNSNLEPRFGKDVFKIKNKTQKRLVFEYTGEATMSLKYNKKRKQIIFDHLSSYDPNLTGSYQFYGPDFTYDALQEEKGKWILIENVPAFNEESGNPIVKPDKKDKVIYERK